MDEEILSIIAEESGERIDALLARTVTGLSRSAAQRLIEKGAVRIGGRPVQKNTRCEAGTEITLLLPETEEVPLIPQEISLDIVYEDADLVVVNKPRGMVVHPAPGHPDGTLVNALLWHCGDSLSGIGGEKRPGIVHRIDKDTSGLLIVAKNDFAHQALSAQLADRSLSRVYEAVVRGRLREESPSPVQRVYPGVLPSGDGADSSDPGPHGQHRASASRRRRLRCSLPGKRSGRAVPSCAGAEVHSSAHRRACASDDRAAGLVYGSIEEIGA